MENTAKNAKNQEGARKELVNAKVEKYATEMGIPVNRIKSSKELMSMINRLVDEEELATRMDKLKSILSAKLNGSEGDIAEEPKRVYRLHVAPSPDHAELAKIVSKPAVATESKLVKLGRQHPGQFPEMLWLQEQEENWFALRGILLGRFIPLKKVLDINHELVMAGQTSLDIIHEVLEKVFGLDRDAIKAGRASDLKRREVQMAIDQFTGTGLTWYFRASGYIDQRKSQPIIQPKAKIELSADAKAKADAKKAYEADAKSLLEKANSSYAKKNQLSPEVIARMVKKVVQKGFEVGLAVEETLKERAIGVFMADGDTMSFRVHAKAAGLTQQALRYEVEARRTAQAEAAVKEAAKRQDPNWGACKKASQTKDKKKGKGKKRG